MINKIFKSFLTSSSYKLEKDKLSHIDWESLLLSMENSNLMQSWHYAEAMKEVGWKLERYIVYHMNEVIACVYKSGLF